MGKEIKRAEAVESRRHGNPALRLTQDGYTRNEGSPTCYQVRLKGETRWRRVYIWQFSNIGTNFVKIKGENIIISVPPLP